MKLIILFGPQAVGKMTVGHELEKITGLKLFHNHMTIELVSKFFDYSTDAGKKLVYALREEVFKQVSVSKLDGLIFTYVWAFDQQSDSDYIRHVVDIFKNNDATVYFVELEASLDERLRRNQTEHRLQHKATKQDIQTSVKDLKESAVNHRLNSQEGEVAYENYLRIDNTELSPAEVASRIKSTFDL